MQRLITFLLVLVALAFARPATAHGSHDDVIADAPIAAAAAVVDGVVHTVTVDDEVTHAISDYRLLVTSRGTVNLLHGAAAETLATGAQYTVRGTINGKYLRAESATLVANAVAKSTVVTSPFAITGTLRMGHMDYTDRPSEYFYAVFTADGKQWMLPGTELLDALQNSMEVSAFGAVMPGGAYIVERIVVHRHAAAVSASEPHTKAAASHTLFVVPVKFPTNLSPLTYPAEAFSVATLDSAVFGAAPAKSVVEYYKEVSYGQQTLTGITANSSSQWLQATDKPAVDNNGKATCDWNFISAQGQTAAIAAGYTNANVTPGYSSPGSTAAVNHVVYVFSSAGFNCGWSGLAYIGYGLAFVKQTTSLTVIGHELGHTFGLYHAGSLDCGDNPIGGTCTVAEYGDPFDVMGNQSAMHFNAFQKQTLKWIADATVKTHVRGTATYALNPVEAPGGVSYAVKIPAGPSRTYWLEYRQPLGFDSAISPANANGALVRVARPLEKMCGSCDSYSNDTQLLDMTTATSTFSDAALTTGTRFVDAYYGVIVDVLSRTGTELDVKVTSLAKVPHPDFDASATTDLIWRSAATGQTVLALMNGLVTSKSTLVMNDAHWLVTRAVDLNGDGTSDLIWQNATSGQTSLWLMNGTVANAASVVMTDGNWTVQDTADFNGDGKTDLIWRNASTGMTSLWLMNGTSASAATVVMTNPDWSITKVADFNGDGKSDLVWHNSETGQTSIWLMNGLGATAASVVMTDPAWTVSLAGDFNGDGKSDIVWRNSTSGATAIWLMNGLSATQASVVMNDATWEAKDLGDFNGDGNTDILWRSTSGQTLAWLMNGTAASGSTTLMQDANWSVSRIGDFDGNGKSDILWTDASSGKSVIWLMNGLSASALGVAGADPNWQVQMSY